MNTAVSKLNQIIQSAVKGPALVKSILAAFLMLPFYAIGGEWCTVTNFGATSNTGSTTLNGQLSGPSGSAWKDWLVMDVGSDPSAAKSRLALTITAATSGKKLQLYVADPYDCVTVPNWQPGVVMHMRFG